MTSGLRGKRQSGRKIRQKRCQTRFVYAVVHDGQGNFLIAQKNEKGYFFSSNGGKIVPDGQLLNGSGLSGFPGGGLGTDNPTDGALREFWEETNVQLQNYNYQAQPEVYVGDRYYGVYFNVGNQLNDLLTIIAG